MSHSPSFCSLSLSVQEVCTFPASVSANSTIFLKSSSSSSSASISSVFPKQRHPGSHHYPVIYILKVLILTQLLTFLTVSFQCVPKAISMVLELVTPISSKSSLSRFKDSIYLSRSSITFSFARFSFGCSYLRVSLTDIISVKYLFLSRPSSIAPFFLSNLFLILSLNL
jgi:hypothetical protein